MLALARAWRFESSSGHHFPVRHWSSAVAKAADFRHFPMQVDCDRSLVIAHSRGLLGAFWGPRRGPRQRFRPSQAALSRERPPMALNDTMIRAARSRERDWKLTDGRGLYLLVTTKGAKLWRLKFRHLGTEKKLSLGAYVATRLCCRSCYGCAKLGGT